MIVLIGGLITVLYLLIGVSIVRIVWKRIIEKSPYPNADVVLILWYWPLYLLFFLVVWLYGFAKSLFTFVTESKQERLLKKLSELYPNDLCRPGIIFSKLDSKYYAGIHVFGDSVFNRTIVFSCTGTYRSVLDQIERRLNNELSNK